MNDSQCFEFPVPLSSFIQCTKRVESELNLQHSKSRHVKKNVVSKTKTKKDFTLNNHSYYLCSFLSFFFWENTNCSYMDHKITLYSSSK